MIQNNYLIIMAGGVGSRFWPMSTAETPKQFLDILGLGKTLIQQTIERFDGIVDPKNILVVTSKAYKAIVQEQCPELKEENILLEPCMRNTAPCIAYASYKIAKENPNANIVVAPSDHLITNTNDFQSVVRNGLKFVSENEALLTIGIQPHRPETGYGYIQIEDPKTTEIINPVKAFKEKPNLETAESYIKAGNYFWNSGIFFWSVKSIITAIETHIPEVAEIFQRGNAVYGSSKEQEFIDSEYPGCINISVDYGIMEKANNIFVHSGDFGWSDLGTWGSLWEKRSKDNQGNAVVGDEVKLFDSSNCIVHMPENKKVVIQGLEDYIVVESKGTLLICQKKEEQRIKEFQK
ncbi:MAG: mannose-1-phosphate guanylyltransferase [Bacteroidales bacterium]